MNARRMADVVRTRCGPAARVLLPFGISAVLAAAHWATTEPMQLDSARFDRPGDHHKYVAMATGGLGSFHLAPFCWRIAVPWIASHLPFDLETSFLAISLVAVALTGGLIYRVVAATTLGTRWAWAGIVVFHSMGWASRFPIYDFWLTDAMTNLVVAAAVHEIQRKRDLSLAAILTLGAATKETTILVVVLRYGLRYARTWDPQQLIRSLCVALPAVAVLLTVRTFIPAFNDDAAYVAALPEKLRSVTDSGVAYRIDDVLSTVGVQRTRSMGPGLVRTVTTDSFGIAVTMLAILGALSRREWLTRTLPFLTAVLLQVFLATDARRVVNLAFVTVVVATVAGLREISDRVGVGHVGSTTVLGLALLVPIYVGGGISMPRATVQAWAASALVVSAAWRWTRRPKAAQSA